MSSMYKYCKSGDVKNVKRLVKSGHDVNLTLGELGETPLIVAVRNQHIDVVNLLLDVDGIDINANTYNHDTALHIAAVSGDCEALRLLLKKQAKPDMKDKEGMTPLHHAAKTGNPETVDILLKFHSNIHAPDIDGWTPLHYAAQSYNQATVEVLLKAEANVDVRDNARWTPLHEAAWCGNPGVVDALLKIGADINATDIDSDTPLCNAIRSNHEQTVQVLLQAGATITDETRNYLRNAPSKIQSIIQEWENKQEQHATKSTEDQVSPEKQIPDHTLQKLKLDADTFQETVATEFQNIRDNFKSVQEKLDDFNKSLENAVFRSTEEVKEHVNNNVKCLSNNIKENTDNQLNALKMYTMHQLNHLSLTKDHNDFINFKLYQNLSNTVGLKVKLWKKLAKELLSSLPDYDEVIEQIDNSYPTEREKAFEVFVHWKAFGSISDIQTLINVMIQIGLPDVSKDINEAVMIYYRHKIIHLENFSEMGMSNLAAEIGSEWRTLGLQLGFKKARIDKIESDHSKDLQYCITVLLIEWNRMNEGSSEDKLICLKEALRKSNRSELVDTLQLSKN